MLFQILLGIYATGCVAIPPPLGNIDHYKSPLQYDEDYASISRDVVPSLRATTFKHKYVLQGGVISDSSSGVHIEVAATISVTTDGHYKAALIVSRMVKHMPHSLFTNLAHHNARVGVFSHNEKLTIYPEFHHLADRTECYNTCSGSCSSTCTFDGRKWETVAGAGGIRAVCTVDNVLCDKFDPYRHHDNIMLHEFAHTIMNYGMDHSTKAKVVQAYNHAKANAIWDPHSYAMANNQEYWAEASGAFFNAEHQHGSNGHMNECGSSFCTSEYAARENIRRYDTQLYNVLQLVYTSNNPSLPGQIGQCVH